MFQSIAKQVERIGSFIGEHPFSCGFLAGLAVVLAFLLFIFLLGIIFRSRKLRCIVIPVEGGELRIDAKAVQGAVLAVAEKFPAFTVRRVALYGKPNAVELQVAMDFNGVASLSDQSAQFRAAIARMMTDVLGMEKPALIEFEILRSGAVIPEDDKADSDKSSASAGPEPPPAAEPGQSC